MRNIRTISELHAPELGLVLGETKWPVIGWDVLSNSVLVATRSADDQTIRLIQQGLETTGNGCQFGLVEPVTIAELPCGPDDVVVGIHVLLDEAATCVMLSGGDIILVRNDPLPDQQAIEIIGTVDGGIEAVSWSPDSEIVLICTRETGSEGRSEEPPEREDSGAGRISVLFMTRDFDTLTTVKFKEDDKLASKHVSVGWGKAETQFKGRRAKALRDPTMPETVDQGLLSSRDDGKVTISWRGDGAYVAVNSLEHGRGRMIRVFSRDGDLDSVSEPVDGLEGALSWRPAGNLIAGVKRGVDKVEIVFFERNGLRHGEFELQEAPDGPVSVHWNSDSTVLAVVAAGRVQLWTMGNYHYYLKQEIDLGPSSRSDCQVSVTWNPENLLTLAVFFSGPDDSSLVVKKLGFAATSGIEQGSTLVVDGRWLKYTPLALANVPPPMSLVDWELDEQISAVAMSTDETMISVALKTKVVEFAITGRRLTLENEYPLRTDGSVGWRSVIQTVIVNGRSYCLVQAWGQCRTSVLDCAAGSILDHDLDGNIVTLFAGLDCDELFAQTESGAVTGLFDQKAGPVCQMPGPTPWISATRTDGGNVVIAGQTADGRLFVNGTRLMTNCTSFVLTRSHLLVTDSRNVLRFAHIPSDGPVSVLIPTLEPGADERCRSVERGARLVTAIPPSSAVILQMPRGNLETIYPRALVLASIRRHIKASQYGRAMAECRAHRVDMNMLYDYDPAQFDSQVSLFVDQVGAKESDLDLFLSQLREEDVCKTMYQDTLVLNGHSPPTEPTQAGMTDGKAKSKVNSICLAIRAILDRDDGRFKNKISACVCMSPPDLESGLEIVAKSVGSDVDRAEKAAEHICFLADPNDIYRAALGMYNLPLTILIAQQAQRDPREYVPFLQSLNERPELDRKFAIDDHLGRHEKAVHHLFEVGDFEKTADYVQQHSLYGPALLRFRYQADKLSVIVRLQAEFLLSKHQYRAAAIAYESLSDYRSALEAYRQSSDNWKEALAAASLIPLSNDQMTELASSLASSLTITSDHRAAAAIQLDYLDDLPAALESQCLAGRYSDAIRLAGLRRRPDLLESVVDSGIGEGFATLTELISDCKSQLSAQMGRLQDLRLKKQSDPLGFLEGRPSDDDPNLIPDNISIASSAAASTFNGTFMTRYSSGGQTGTTGNTSSSRKTSKNRRREERKRARGKKGTVYEEEYLIGSLGRLGERINTAVSQVVVLQESLVRRNMMERARVLGIGMAELVEQAGGIAILLSSGQDTVQPHQDGPDGDDVEDRHGHPDGLSGGERVLQESIAAMSKKIEPPKLKSFQTLVLVDY